MGTRSSAASPSSGPQISGARSVASIIRPLAPQPLGESVLPWPAQVSSLPESVVTPKWPVPDLEVIDAIARSGLGCYELWESSPHRFKDEAPKSEEIVDVVFPGDPLLCCAQRACHFATRRRSTWRGSLDQQAYIVPNPMLRVVDYTLDGKLSEHTLAATAARVYQVVEFDFKQFARDGKTLTPFAPLISEWSGRRPYGGRRLCRPPSPTGRTDAIGSGCSFGRRLFTRLVPSLSCAQR